MTLCLHSSLPVEDSGRAMAIIIPFLVSSEQILPRMRFFKAPVRHTPLNTKRRFYIILIGTFFLNLLFFDAKQLTHLSGLIGDKHRAVIRDQDFGDAILSNRTAKHCENCL